MIGSLHLLHPGRLWLLLLLVPLLAWYIYSLKTRVAPMRASNLNALRRLGGGFKSWLRHVPMLLRMAAIACVVIILCRPQRLSSWSTSDVEGTDIILAIDVSTSMLARDFNPNRMDAAKDVAAKFAAGREHDNVGVVIFAGESFTQVPMTMDNATLVNAIREIQLGVIEDGTAIGDGIATAINRIKDGKAKSKSIILLTDGSNNTGIVAPLSAAGIARKFGIKIYTIGVGTNGMAPTPVAVDALGNYQYQNMKVVIDEATLKQIAATTGGKYFRATGNRVLQQVFDEIDSLEKTKLDVQNYTHSEDAYMPWALALLLLVSLDILLRYTLLRHI